MDVLDPHLQDGGLPLADDLVLHVVCGLVDQLLDARGVDAAVHHEPLHGTAGDLAADGVEAAEGHGLRRVVDDEVHSRQHLEGADVAALAADDAPLHLLRGEGDDADRRLARALHGAALHGRDDDVAGPAVRLAMGPLLQLLQAKPDEVLGVLLRLAEQDFLSVLLRHLRDLLQLVALLPDQRFEVRAALLDRLLLQLQLVLLVGNPVELSVQVLLPLLQLALGPLKLGPPLLDVAIGLLPQS